MATATLTPVPAARRARPLSRSAGRTTHLTKRGRVAVVVALFLVLAALVAFAGRAPVEASPTRSAGSVVRYVTVHPGETLWQIAVQTRPSADPRDTVDRIIEINGLHGGVVVAGQRLAVPASR